MGSVRSWEGRTSSSPCGSAILNRGTALVERTLFMGQVATSCAGGGGGGAVDGPGTSGGGGSSYVHPSGTTVEHQRGVHLGHGQIRLTWD